MKNIIEYLKKEWFNILLIMGILISMILIKLHNI